MARVYPFRTDSGSEIIPISDASFFTDTMDAVEDVSECYFAFYSDASAETPATPSAGTITVNGEYASGFFLASPDGDVNASQVITPDAAYTPPALDGHMIRARVDLSGITGASHMKAFVYKR